MVSEKIRQAISDYIDANRALFTELSHYIWDNPELSLREYKACEKYAALLREGGFQVETGVCGIDTAVRGVYGSGRPVIAFLGEYDALSGLSQTPCALEKEPVNVGGNGHGCGHNMLGAGSLAAAFAAKHYLQESGRKGTVIFYGCPGEEGGAAKAFMAREGLFYDLDAAFSWHPSDVNEVRTGTNNTSLQLLYKFTGVSAHAAGDPENGRSALDAVELMNIGVQYLREHMGSQCRVHYAMINGGGYSPNVVQPEASVLYMVRSVKVKESLELLERVDKIAQGAALMTETSLERIFLDGTANLVPNYALEKILYENFAALGTPEPSREETEFAASLKATYCASAAPGIAAAYDSAIADWVMEKTGDLSLSINDFLMPEYHTGAFIAGSTDVGDVSWQCPTAQINAVCFPSCCPGHSWQMVSCSRSPLGDAGLINAGKVLACSAAELFEKPELLADIKAEFKKRTKDGYVCPIPAGVEPVAPESFLI